MTQKMADQEWFDVYVVFTMILCVFKLQETLITLLSKLTKVLNQTHEYYLQMKMPNKVFDEAIWSLPVNISFIPYQRQKDKTAKNHSKNYMKARPLLIRHL